MHLSEYFNCMDSKSFEVLKASNVMDSTLLITGQTGTGKSRLAQSIHELSRRFGKRYFKINLATLSESLMESELFGHERGAFTGADCRRWGKLEMGNGGTVFLDEIGDLSLKLQSKLLDFIQYKKFFAVGSNKEVELDVRIIAATNRDLENEVKQGNFREDLYHRLNVFQIKLFPISSNKSNLLRLAKSILKNKSHEALKSIHGFQPEVEKKIEDYNWPGNIRELENVIEYAVAMEQRNLISLDSLPERFFSMVINPLEKEGSNQIDVTINNKNLLIPFSMDYQESKNYFEKTYIENALKLFNGRINLTSKMTNLNKVSLAEKIKRHKIDWQKIKMQNIKAADSVRDQAVDVV